MTSRSSEVKINDMWEIQKTIVGAPSIRMNHLFEIYDFLSTTFEVVVVKKILTVVTLMVFEADKDYI